MKMMVVFMGGLFWASALVAQEPKRMLSVPATTLISDRRLSESIIPKPIQANPQNHAPLCRLETKIERQLPIGIWFKLDGPSPFQYQPSQAYVRFRIPLK